MRITTLALDTVTESGTGAVEFTFTPRHLLRQRAGQAGLLLIPGGGAKPFTFSSGADAPQVSIATSLHSGSRFKTALAALRPGSQVTVAGGFGGPRPVDAAVPQVFIAQGIGITPFLSLARTHQTMNATLLQVGTAHYFADVAAAVHTAEHHTHREQLTAAIARTIATTPHAQWMISGRSGFVSATAEHLRAAGIDRRSIGRASFTGMRSTSPAAGRAFLPA